MAEWRKKADAVCFDVDSTRNTCFPLVSSLTTSSRMPGMMGKAYIAMNLSTPCCVGIYANNMFDEEGKYAGFDDTEPTSRSGGKAEAVKRIKASNGFQTVYEFMRAIEVSSERVSGGFSATCGNMRHSLALRRDGSILRVVRHEFPLAPAELGALAYEALRLAVIPWQRERRLAKGA
ncbi:hypothetical protein PPROV_000753900 [Pycnococcus provasolii]|uniref:Uncharacterized protein n=1 Tax=Pycnococcus provasolii TaxID=41880 RepID=A0A830HPE1_9CHLO|nr:hypothetical protein PPROV_000753900 [Pycnococcus provasolii]